MSSTLEGLIERLSDDNEGMRWNAAEALGRLGDPRAVDPLIDTLWDDDARVRQKAAYALGLLGDPRALGPLQKLYRIEREDARDIIQEAMEMIKRVMARDLQ
ncbi:PBS lyase HEAT domain protein repeat-containing protein [Methanoregula boonei 6A8]|uniref:PBS lyase HEAT domain protein repeat-containing protein n=1 Tax=Methanoregula boonei (strain DSM 21154 / JCM 14090 / 6A8) TaxID=456442 RepID=A7I552_METB6|nr:HEAT repeat domain-containing protein [Methanoregula boonei]ABS54863.1 PBS lyase HEAT domain protein repeat-containing protein [Methanoregula boonei 6A8]